MYCGLAWVLLGGRRRNRGNLVHQYQITMSTIETWTNEIDILYVRNRRGKWFLMSNGMDMNRENELYVCSFGEKGDWIYLLTIDRIFKRRKVSNTEWMDGWIHLFAFLIPINVDESQWSDYCESESWGRRPCVIQNIIRRSELFFNLYYIPLPCFLVFL